MSMLIRIKSHFYTQGTTFPFILVFCFVFSHKYYWAIMEKRKTGKEAEWVSDDQICLQILSAVCWMSAAFCRLLSLSLLIRVLRTSLLSRGRGSKSSLSCLTDRASVYLDSVTLNPFHRVHMMPLSRLRDHLLPSPSLLLSPLQDFTGI